MICLALRVYFQLLIRSPLKPCTFYTHNVESKNVCSATKKKVTENCFPYYSIKLEKLFTECNSTLQLFIVCSFVYNDDTTCLHLVEN